MGLSWASLALRSLDVSSTSAPLVTARSVSGLCCITPPPPPWVASGGGWGGSTGQSGSRGLSLGPGRPLTAQVRPAVPVILTQFSCFISPHPAPRALVFSPSTHHGCGAHSRCLSFRAWLCPSHPNERARLLLSKDGLVLRVRLSSLIGERRSAGGECTCCVPAESGLGSSAGLGAWVNST